MLPVASGAIEGTAALAFAGTNVLTGSGALLGTAALTITPAGTITGAGSLTGTAAIVFAGTNTLTGAGTLLGTAGIAFTPAAALLGTGAMTGSSALVFTPAGAITAAGALLGSSAVTFAGTDTLVGAGALLGTSALVFGGSAETAGDIAGTCAITITGSATATASGALLGTSAMAFAGTNTLTATAVAAGTAALQFDRLAPPLNLAAAYWKFEGLSGSSITDELGPLALTPNASFTSYSAGKHNNAAIHTTAVIRRMSRAIADAGALNTGSNVSDAASGAFSLSTWRKFDGSALAGANMAGTIAGLGDNNDGASEDWGWMLWFEYDEGVFARLKLATRSKDDVEDIIEYDASSTPFADNEWHHYVVTRAAGANAPLKLYYDGNLVASGTSTGVGETTTAFHIGAFGRPGSAVGVASGSAALRGGIDESAFFTSVLTDDQVAALYLSGTGLFLDTDTTSEMTGNGVLLGACGATFTPTSTATGAGAVAGSAAITFAFTATTAGSGSLAGESDLTLGDGTVAIIGIGILVGSAANTFTGAGTVNGSGLLASAAALTFGAGSSTMVGAGALTGSSAMVFTAAEAGSIVPGPFRIEAVQLFSPGAEAAQVYQPGAVVAQSYSPGAEAAQGGW